MKRLTDTNDKLLNGLYNKDLKEPINKLAAYEDTGLTPEEVRTLINNAEKAFLLLKRK